MNPNFPWSRLVIAASGVLGFGGGLAFFSSYWLEPTAVSTSSLGSPASFDALGQAASTLSGEPEAVPASDLTVHPAAVSEMTRLGRDLTATEEQLEIAASQLGIADFPGVLEQVTLRSHPDLAETLISRWAELAPRAAAEFLLAHDGDLPGRSLDLFKSVLHAWMTSPTVTTSSDARAEVLAWVEKLPSLQRYLALFPSLVILAEQDPAAAAKLYLAHPELSDDAKELRPFFDHLARHDPARALELALRLDAKGREHITPQILQHWVTRAPQAALAWVREHPAMAAELIPTLFRVWGQFRPAEAFAAVEQLPPGPQREEAQKLAAVALAAVDPARMQAWLAAQPATLGRTEIALAVSQDLSHRDPRQATALAAALPPSAQRNTTLENILRTWAEQNPPEAAAALLATFPPGAARDSALSSLTAWATLAPEQALGWMIREAPESDVLLDMMDTAFERHSTAVRAWLETQPPSAARDRCFGQYVTQLLVKDPVQALVQLSQWPASEELATASGMLARGWAARNPAATATWASELNHPAMRAAANGEIAAFWVRRDQPATMAWIETLPVGPERDSALTSYATSGAVAPARSAVLAEQITDAEQRVRSLTPVYYRWRAEDEAAALKFLHRADSPLSAEEKQTLHTESGPQ